MTRKKKRKSKKNKISNLTNTILSILKKERNKSFNYKQIAAIIGVNDASSRNQIIKTLAKLAAKQEIEQVHQSGTYLSAKTHCDAVRRSPQKNEAEISGRRDQSVFIRRLRLILQTI